MDSLERVLKNNGRQEERERILNMIRKLDLSKLGTIRAKGWTSKEFMFNELRDFIIKEIRGEEIKQ